MGSWVVRGREDEGEAPLERLGLDAPLSPASQDPDPLKPRPWHRARAWEAGRGTKLEKEGGGEKSGSGTRPTHWGCASCAFPPPASPSFPPPSVCLPLALSVCSAAPRLPATSSARSRPPPARAQSQRAPVWLARAAARGPLSGGPSVRRRGPGTRSAAERRGAG